MTATESVEGTVPHTVHPRPQLVRPDWTDLCGEWGFAYDDDNVGLTERWQESDKPFDRSITVPYPPESARSGVHDPAYHPVVWYRLETAVATPRAGERLLLHFGAVDYRATVWVDGLLVGRHEGGHTPFAFDVTDALNGTGATQPLDGPDGDRHVLVVRAEDRPTDVTQPRGKQDWQAEPHAIWYHRTTGIWQPVWLEHVPATHVSDLQWTPEVDAGRVRVELRLSTVPTRPLTVAVHLRLGDEVLAEQRFRVEDDHAVADVAIPALRNGQDEGRLLWSPEQPTLVQARVELHDGARGQDSLVDGVDSYLGLRSADIGDGRFLLNGHPYYVRSVLEQGYWPESHLAAPDPDALRREVELVKELGFNAVRIHQKVEDPRFLYWCDRLGLLVWGEMANAYEFGPTAVERLTREWLDVVRRDRSHPCVVTWVPINESWGIQHASSQPAQRSLSESLYHLTKALDPSRPVLANDGWEHSGSDIVGVHDYAPRGDDLRERYADAAAVEHTIREGRPAMRPVLLPGFEPGDRPVMLTEFGGVRYSLDPGDEGWGYSQSSTEQEYAERLAELVDAVLESRALAGFCYTQLTDTEQEQNGLLTADRRPKIPAAQVREIIGRAARSMPLEALTRPTERGQEAATAKE
ncbi:MAG TPA: glycoside hydrolase family 2 TIM barrel-domain containing protein [Nocardioidaceae bacterium]|nr:glycoside hydrolase family 2 TIM barrel-domain containing protein [Nocardioidaceae bacterium]